ncbi:MAG: leucine-rich repeat domain-containing protein [Bacteroidetes bacterium]|nr:leucine-rich repeat domain-containing protein [Bacteroidota bacterium]
MFGITEVASLPAQLRLVCFNNQLRSLPSLPSSLNYLNCENNQITSLPSLPSSLSF